MPALGKSQYLQELGEKIRVCPLCPLCNSRTRAVPGEGNITAKAMIIGEAPGKDEDTSGHPFVGSAGKYLDHVLEGSNVSRADFFITNIVKCRPPQNRQPRANEVEICTSSYLFKQIETIHPCLIVLLGGVAAKKLLGARKVEEVRGKITEHQGRRYLVTYHPAVRFYREDLAAKLKEDFQLLREEMERLKHS